MFVPLPMTAISESVPVPWMAKSNMASSPSLLLIVTVALRVPLALGLNVIWKVVLPPAATGDAGVAMTLKSDACVPLRLTPETVRFALPGFAIVKVRVIVPLATLWLPKSVWSVLLGVASPSLMFAPLPLTAISGLLRITCDTPAAPARPVPKPPVDAAPPATFTVAELAETFSTRMRPPPPPPPPIPLGPPLPPLPPLASSCAPLARLTLPPCR